jgi:MoxR-like ATPase
MPAELRWTESVRTLKTQMARVILGKSEAIDLCLITLLAEGHLLIEDVPGVGKTTLARSLARSLDLSFARIQFTPDLMPSDVIGVSVYSPEKSDFQFFPGPIFRQVILADEINRTTPRTQSSLLEAMNDTSVSVDGTTHLLPRPFLVLATQNPVEFKGTYPLPESQLDRFLARIRLGYPPLADEKEILRRRQLENPLDSLQPVMTAEEIIAMQQEVKTVLVDETLLNYMVEVVEKTRQHPAIEVGISPRGTLGLFRAAQAAAYLAGRHFVIPDDVKFLIPFIFAHRLVLKTAVVSGQDRSSEGIIDDIVKSVVIPH